MERKYESKILLVDDNSKNIQVAMSILKDFNVIYAQSGQKVLELIKEHDFDLILLDIVMPLLNGFEVCKLLKEDEKTKSIPVIFLTVKDDEKDILKGYELGAVDYITKPFCSSILLKRVQLHLNLSKAISDLQNVNENLNEKVEHQVKELRKKDEMLFQQSKIIAMSNIIDVISLKWKQPLNMVKMYLQSMQLLVNEDELKEFLKKTLHEVSILDETMHDFQKFFKNDLKKEEINVKVMIDNVLFLLKEEFEEYRIHIDITGDHLSNLFIVEEELKHVIMKLIINSINSIDNKNDNVNISFYIKENEENIDIQYRDNISNSNNFCNLLDSNKSLKSEEFDLSFYLVKIFIEKNSGRIEFNESDSGIDMLIRFSK